MKGILPGIEASLDIPDKRYFTIGEVGELCGLKTHVLRYWETEFPQLNPVKRRGNRRYYQRDDVLVVRTIQHLVHEEGFTIAGARQKLQQLRGNGKAPRRLGEPDPSTAPAAAEPSQQPSGLPKESIPRDFAAYFEQAGQTDQGAEPQARKGPAPSDLSKWCRALEEARKLLDDPRN